MSSAGIWMLGLLALLVVTTGLPVWALLVGVASAFAAFGVATGVFDSGILASLGPRLTSLFEHDLLQALPLYVFIGVLLQRLPLANALFNSTTRLLGRTAAAPPLAALAVGTLIAPMNGSVASSSALLSRLVAPRLRELPAERAVALVSVAATIGVVVPPSLVLILLGDFMLRAHTEASNLPGFVLGSGQRIINTQDVLKAALVPAILLLGTWALLTYLQNRRAGGTAVQSAVTPREGLLAALTAGAIAALLAGVFVGRLFAVEAAATGGCLLLLGTLASRALDVARWREVLRDTLNLSGALFALLVGATTFSLVFRLFGTDRWLIDLMQSSPWPSRPTAALVLLLVALCAFVLDAFEMIFVIIPLVAPLLIVHLGDAQQTAVLLLLVLQLSFLLPPLGYAVLMARSGAGFAEVTTGRLLRALAPFVVAQTLVTALVFAWPGAVHLLDTEPTEAASMSPDELTRQMEEMSRPDAVSEEGPDKKSP